MSERNKKEEKTKYKREMEKKLIVKEKGKNDRFSKYSKKFIWIKRPGLS